MLFKESFHPGSEFVDYIAIVGIVCAVGALVRVQGQVVKLCLERVGGRLEALHEQPLRGADRPRFFLFHEHGIFPLAIIRFDQRPQTALSPRVTVGEFQLGEIEDGRVNIGGTDKVVADFAMPGRARCFDD